MNAKEWRLDDLRPHPSSFFDDDGDNDFDALVASIREDGLFNPIVTTPDGTILAGHRRVAAFRKLGLKKIPAFIRETPTYRDGLVFAIKDNVARQHLIPGVKALWLSEITPKPKRSRKKPAESAPAPTPKPTPAEVAAAEAPNFEEARELYLRLHALLRRQQLAKTSDAARDAYATLLRDIAISAWHEVERVYGESETGRQMSLLAIMGGGSENA